MRPLLLLDVDGPLHPLAADQPPPGHVEFRFRLSWRRTQRVWLNLANGRLLLGLAERTGIALPVVEFAGPHAGHHAGGRTQPPPASPTPPGHDDFALRPEARDRFSGGSAPPCSPRSTHEAA